MTPFIVVTNNPTPDYLAINYTTPGQALSPDVVRNDAEDVSVAPVVENTPGVDPIYSADYDATDALSMAIGLVDTPPTAGSCNLLVGSTPVNTVAYNISAAALQTALNAALTTESKPLCTVVENEDGAYSIAGVTNGTVVDGFFSVADASLLYPASDAFFVLGSEGSGSSKYAYTFVMRIAPFCVADLSDELPDADVQIDTVQAGAADANKIQQISFLNDPYTGSYTISATANGVTASCGLANWGMTIGELGQVLANHPEIDYNNTDGTADNIRLSFNNGNYTVEFIGTLANDDANEFTVLNWNLVGPKGKSGLIHYNTQGLYIYSLSQGDSFELTRTIQRTRTSGEILTIYSAPVTILKDAINAATFVPSPLTNYYTSSQVDTFLAGKQDLDSTLTAISGAGTTGTGAVVGASGATMTGAIIRQAGTALTADGAITIASGIVYLEKTSAGAFTIAAPSSQDNTRITIIGNTDFAHVVTFTGATLKDGVAANTTATFTAVSGSAITVVARGAFWLLESNNGVTLAP